MGGLGNRDVTFDEVGIDEVDIDTIEADTVDGETGDVSGDDPTKKYVAEDDRVDAVDSSKDDSDASSEDDSDAQRGPSLVGVRSYRWRRQPAHLLSWWEQLPEATQSSLAGLRPGDPLDPAAAEAVDAVGFSCAQVWMTDPAGRRIRRRIAPAALITQVQLLRMTHSERRLV